MGWRHTESLSLCFHATFGDAPLSTFDTSRMEFSASALSVFRLSMCWSSETSPSSNFPEAGLKPLPEPFFLPSSVLIRRLNAGEGSLLQHLVRRLLVWLPTWRGLQGRAAAGQNNLQ